MRSFNFLVLGIIGAVVIGISFVVKQGVPKKNWASFDLAKVDFDSHGIPTIEARDWLSLSRAQGYVVASERLWQMDLYRRAGGGRLAEWFGEKAVEHDIGRRNEDWLGVAERASALLPAEQRMSCDAYAEGVNRFIDEYKHNWSIEYALLRTDPERWACRDSILVLMGMVADLTRTADRDLLKMQWKASLSQDWYAFLFPKSHPWNVPLFGIKSDHGPDLPGVADYLEATPFSIQEASVFAKEDFIIGSNSWAYNGNKGHFLANDPHLATRVPQLWYALRLFISQNEWVAGVSIPGIPGIVLGMNQDIAWAFTNTGEDVDDWLIEDVDSQAKTYTSRNSSGGTTKMPIIEKPYEIKIKGKPTIQGVAQFTHRGPLKKIEWKNRSFYASRQWVGFYPELLRLPSEGMNKARNWSDFNRAVDELRSPSQNVTFMNRRGDYGYRTSGTGILRRADGGLPVEANIGEWAGFEPYSSRHRLLVQSDIGKPTKHGFLGTANERIWIDQYDHRWSADDRKMRMTEALAKNENLDRTDMEALQRDTASPIFKLIMNWLGEHASGVDAATKQRWTTWDGDAKSDPKIFTQASMTEKILYRSLVERVRARFGAGVAALEYDSDLKSAWLITILKSPNGMRVFGLQEHEVADAIAKIVTEDAKLGKTYSENNRWTAQHPFVKGIPVLGAMFAVDTPPMKGFRGVLRIERPEHSASTRLVWDLSDPANSTWIFPVGQSGHAWNEHFKDQQKLWFDDATLPVFPEERGIHAKFFAVATKTH